jgi:hypothetical protein
MAASVNVATSRSRRHELKIVAQRELPRYKARR